MSNEFVSIVMATYNGSKYLRQQLDSIVNQSHQNFELIVVDDCSIDDTVLIIKEYQAWDGRIRLYTSDKNKGFVANFERGLKLAKGEFIVLADQDDIFRQDKIELSVNKLNVYSECDLVVSDLSLIDSEGRLFSHSMWQLLKLRPSAGRPFRRLILSNFATGCAITIRRRLLNIALPFPEGIVSHDWWFAVVAASQRGGGICLISEPLTLYRQHEFNAIGIEPLRPNKVFSIMSLFNRLKVSASDTMQNKVMDFININKGRLDGYLSVDLWTYREIKIINQTIFYFNSFSFGKKRWSINRLFFSQIRRGYIFAVKFICP